MTENAAPLDGCEEVLTNPEELYLKQVSPSRAHWDGERVGSAAFSPSAADAGQLSGARSSKQTPQGAYEERERHHPGKSVGTWALSVQDVAEVEAIHQTNLRLIDDSECPDAETVGHTYLDMRDYLDLPRNEREEIRARLTARLNRRGCLHRGQSS